MYEILTRHRPGIKLNGTQFRKEIIRFGQYRHPNPLFRDDDDGDWDFTIKDAKLMVENFKAKVVESVKFLDIHNEDLGKKLGAVIELEQTKTGVTAIIEIEDEGTLKDVMTIGGDGKPLAHGVSSGIDMGFANAEAGKDDVVKGPVLRHVALATIPWIQGMSDWEKVEDTEGFSHRAFGHDEYTGIPLVHEKDGDGEDSGNMNPTMKKALEVLASNSKKTIEEVAESLGIKMDGETEEEENKYSDIVKSLASISSLLENKNDDDDDDDEDDKDDDKDSDAVKAAKRIVEESSVGIKKAVTQITEDIKVLAKGLGESRSQIDASREAQQKSESESAVKFLIEAGKILPKDAEHYVALHTAQPDLFKSVTDTLPVQVTFDEVHADPFQGNPMAGMNNEAITEATERYAKMLEPQEAGKYDRVDGRQDQ